MKSNLLSRDLFPEKNLLEYGSKKYPEFYDFKILAIKSLTYFFDADKEKMPVMIKKQNGKK